MPDSKCRQCGRVVLESLDVCPYCQTAHPCDRLIKRTLRGNIRIDDVLGAGGMGTVYKGFETHLQREVAVKVLNSAGGVSPRSVSYFMQEARVLSRLRHPNLVSVIDFGREDDGMLLMVMELVPGRSLEALISDESPLDPERVVRIMLQILSALEEVHRHNIIHRDLKPSNILLEDVAGAQDFVKVLDFGIAKILQHDLNSSLGGGMTGVGAAIGTPQYMSPEQAQGMSVDVRSDIYSSGILLFEMLTQQLPWDSANVVGMLMQRLAEDVPAPSSLRGGLSPALDRVCLTALAREPSDRFSSALEFREALLNSLSPGLAVMSMPIGPITGVRRTTNHTQNTERMSVCVLSVSASEQDEAHVLDWLQRKTESSGAVFRSNGRQMVVVIIEGVGSEGWCQAADLAIQLRDAVLLRFENASLRVGVVQGNIYNYSLDKEHQMPIGQAISDARNCVQWATEHQIVVPVSAKELLNDHFVLEPKGKYLEVCKRRGSSLASSTSSKRLAAKPFLVGRHVTRRRMEHMVKRMLKVGEGAPVLLTGSDGMGKSLMISCVRELAQSSGIVVLEVSASQEKADRPFRLLFDLVFQYLSQHFQLSERRDVVGELDLDLLVQALRKLGLDAREALLFVEQFFAGTSVDVEMRSDDDAQPIKYDRLLHATSVFSPTDRRRVLIVLLKEIFTLIAGEHGLLLILEDLDAATKSTRQCFMDLVGLVHDSPVLLVATSLKAFDDQLNNAFNVLSLKPLSHEERNLFWGEFEKKNPWKGNKSEILRASGGNPMYLSLWHQDPLEIAPPDNILGLIVEQVARLPGRVRRLLLVASILGYHFEPKVLEGIFPRSSALNIALIESAELGLIEPCFGNERWWRFSNPVLHRVVYRSVTRADRNRYHNNIFRGLEDSKKNLSQRQLLLLVVQACRGSRSYLALDYIESLGDRFALAGDLHGALDWYRLAFDISEAPDRSDGHLSDSRTVQLCLKMMECALQAGDVETFEAIREAIQAQDLDSKVQLTLLCARSAVFSGQYQKALNTLELTSDLTPELACLMHFQRAQTLRTMGDLEGAVEELRASLKIIERIQDTLSLEMSGLSWTVPLLLGQILLALREDDEAEMLMEIAFQRARLVQDANGIVRVLSVLATLLLRNKDPMRLTMLCFEVLQISSISRRPTHLIVLNQLLGQAFRSAGKESQSRASFQNALKLAKKMNWSGSTLQALKQLIMGVPPTGVGIYVSEPNSSESAAVGPTLLSSQRVLGLTRKP